MRSDLNREPYGGHDRDSGRYPAFATSAWAGVARRVALSHRFRMFYFGVVIVQGVHVVEHVIQLAQVYLFGVPDDDALGLLGYVFQFNGTEEWLHLAFNATYLMSLLVVLVGVVGLFQLGRLPLGAFLAFVLGGVGLESWHMVEHIVIISNVVRHHGCPCPGIVDAALGISDTQLHFAYNVIAYAATLIPLSGLPSRVRRQHLPAPRLMS